MPKRSAKCVNSPPLVILPDSAIRYPSPLVSLGQQPVPGRAPTSPCSTRLHRGSPSRWPTIIYLTVRRPGRRCRGPCAADTHNGHAGRRWDDRAVAPCSCGTAHTRLRTRVVTPADSLGMHDGCRFSQTTPSPSPSPSPSRMNGYAGWSRVTGAIPCDRASAQLTRPFRLSSHSAIASGTRTARCSRRGRYPRHARTRSTPSRRSRDHRTERAAQGRTPPPTQA